MANKCRCYLNLRAAKYAAKGTHPGYVCPVHDKPTCPYCGAELVTKDTYGMGGDECWDWCPECERMVP